MPTATPSVPYRIAFATNIVPPYRTRFYERLCATTGYDCTIIHGVTEHEDGRPHFRGTLAAPECHVRNRELQIGPITLRWQRGLLRALRTLEPDLIVLPGIPGNITNWLALAWARLRGVRVVIWACGWEPQARRPLLCAIKHLFARRYYRLADHILTYSTKGKRYLQDMGIPDRQVTVCYNGLEIDDLLAREPEVRRAAASLRDELEASGRTVFLYVGGMIGDKRVELLLHAFKAIEGERADCMLWLIGDGPQRSTYEALATQIGLKHVRFFGRIIEDADKYFAAADFFVLPGVGGLAFNQAMFWGTPCIGGEADGTEDDLIIEDRTGKRFAPGDEAALAAAMRHCAGLPANTRTTWCVEARRIIEDRSNVAKMVQTFIQTFDAVLRKRESTSTRAGYV